MRITAKGQVTVPQEIRDRLGLQPGAQVEFDLDGDTVRLVKVDGGDRGRTLINRMRGTATSRLTTDEIIALTRGQ
ncbi:MAG TPA: AbrB/MazE/SpoVT family DNA-binding domain-containing protein [Candidatus Dormibacteraeota bacterium]|jgi:AbrB family looped-hinge helix DNA binding protein|nr:AbrB/MazE/SpoVT family DNA-binding domain-containing protein [Candidatus Dormibacteraeota bacterium]